jgi:hypothetical protein
LALGALPGSGQVGRLGGRRGDKMQAYVNLISIDTINNMVSILDHTTTSYHGLWAIEHLYYDSYFNNCNHARDDCNIPHQLQYR